MKNFSFADLRTKLARQLRPGAKPAPILAAQAPIPAAAPPSDTDRLSDTDILPDEATQARQDIANLHALFVAGAAIAASTSQDGETDEDMALQLLADLIDDPEAVSVTLLNGLPDKNPLPTPNQL